MHHYMDNIGGISNNINKSKKEEAIIFDNEESEEDVVDFEYIVTMKPKPDMVIDYFQILAHELNSDKKIGK